MEGKKVDSPGKKVKYLPLDPSDISTCQIPSLYQHNKHTSNISEKDRAVNEPSRSFTVPREGPY